MRITIIFDNFGPYHIARVNAAAKVLEITGVELRAQSKTYAWIAPDKGNFRKLTLPKFLGQKKHEKSVLTPHLENALFDSQPDVVAVNGWGDYLAVQSIRWCVKYKVPFIILSESSSLDRPSSWLRASVKRRLITLASSALVGGNPHRQHLMDLGMPENLIFLGYNVVDHDYFVNQAKLVRNSKSFDQAVNRYFIAVNRFIERKNLVCLIEAYATYCKCSTVRPWDLCLLGDGEMKAVLIAFCHTVGLRVVETSPWEYLPYQINDSTQGPIVYFPGFRQVEELPRFYVHAGCFIHPALVEPWGLVVNEAMSSGLPVLVSNRCGCAVDLVDSGINGYTFNPSNPQVLAAQMRDISKSDKCADEFGRQSLQRIEAWTPKRFAAGISSAASCAINIGARRATWIDRIILNILCMFR